MKNRISDDASGGGMSDEPTPTQRRQLIKCKNDVVYWINTFCTTYDPRVHVADLPFKLYPFQEALARRILEQIRQGEDLLIEKSRDMGITWLVLMVFQWLWLFQPGSSFLLGSRKQDFVDLRGDISTLFGKLRYNLYKLPQWMLPKGFSWLRHDLTLRMINPENGNSIIGESANCNFARGGRYKAVFMDEFAYWPQDDLSYASAGQSSPCRIVVSTPHGMANRFADIRFSETTPVATVHWREHPLKDDAWYNRQCRRMTEDEIARELDINYHLSSRDRVFREFTVLHKRQLAYNPFMPVIRSWDFGYHFPACLFLQLDPKGRMVVLHELLGDRIQVRDFAKLVLEAGENLFPHANFEDYADPAGHQHTDKCEETSIEILNTMGIYPAVKSYLVYDGIQLLRQAMTDVIDELPALLVNETCHITIQALEGGYRYRHGTDRVLEEHPFEDVMDCLRYAAIHKLHLTGPRPPHRGRLPARRYQNPGNHYTGY